MDKTIYRLYIKKAITISLKLLYKLLILCNTKEQFMLVNKYEIY